MIWAMLQEPRLSLEAILSEWDASPQLILLPQVSEEDQWKASQELTLLQEDPVYQTCRYVQFISRSAGKNRRATRLREVELLVILQPYHSFRIINNEIKPQKTRRDGRRFVGIDRVAEEVLWFLPDDERTPDELLKQAKHNYETLERLRPFDS